MSSSFSLAYPPDTVVSNYSDEGFVAVHTTALVMLVLSFVGNGYITIRAITTKSFKLLVLRFPFFVSALDMLFSFIHIIDHSLLVGLNKGQRPEWRPRPVTNTTNLTKLWNASSISQATDLMNQASNPWMISSPTYLLYSPPTDTACHVFAYFVMLFVSVQCLLVTAVGIITVLRVVYGFRLELGWMDYRLITVVVGLCGIFLALVGGLDLVGRSEYFCLIDTFSRRGIVAFIVVIGGLMIMLFSASSASFFAVIRFMRHAKENKSEANDPTDAQRARLRALEDAENRIISYLGIHLLRYTGPFLLVLFYLNQISAIGIYPNDSDTTTSTMELPAKIPTWVYVICALTYNMGFLNAIVYYRQMQLIQERVKSSASETASAIESPSTIPKKDIMLAEVNRTSANALMVQLTPVRVSSESDF